MDDERIDPPAAPGPSRGDAEGTPRTGFVTCQACGHPAVPTRPLPTNPLPSNPIPAQPLPSDARGARPRLVCHDCGAQQDIDDATPARTHWPDRTRSRYGPPLPPGADPASRVERWRGKQRLWEHLVGMPVLAAAEDAAADRSARARLWRVFDPAGDAPEVPLTLLTGAQLHDLVINGVTVVYRH